MCHCWVTEKNEPGPSLAPGLDPGLVPYGAVVLHDEIFGALDVERHVCDLLRHTQMSKCGEKRQRWQVSGFARFFVEPEAAAECAVEDKLDHLTIGVAYGRTHNFARAMHALTVQ